MTSVANFMGLPRCAFCRGKVAGGTLEFKLVGRSTSNPIAWPDSRLPIGGIEPVPPFALHLRGTDPRCSTGPIDGVGRITTGLD
jgi:hypothetical protein